MGRYELPQIETAAMGGTPASADVLFAWGMMYAAGNSVPVDLVTAHKWFNLAAMKSHPDAARRRREIAAEMSDTEIGQAQVAAREWLKLNPQPQASSRPMPMQVAA
jgi:TPR repeat protein